MVRVTRIQVLDKAVYLSLCANALEKGMNLSILLSAIDEQWGRLGYLGSVMQPVYEKENSEFNPAVLRLKIAIV